MFPTCIVCILIFPIGVIKICHLIDVTAYDIMPDFMNFGMTAVHARTNTCVQRCIGTDTQTQQIS